MTIPIIRVLVMLAELEEQTKVDATKAFLNFHTSVLIVG